MSNEEQRSWHQNTPTSPIFYKGGDSNYYKFEGNGDTNSKSFDEREEASSHGEVGLQYIVL